MARLDEHRVDAAAEHGSHLLLVRVADIGEANVAERGQFGARPHGAQHEAGLVGVLVGCGAGDAGGGLGELVETLHNVVLAECGEVGAEGVGLDAVGTRVEVCPVNLLDDVRARDVENLVATLEALKILL